MRFHGFEAGVLVGGNDFAEETQNTLRGLRDGTMQFAATTTYGDVGLDIPTLDVGILSCPTAGNPKRMVQQVGRIVRPSPGKADATIYYLWDRAVYGLSHRTKNIRAKWQNVEVVDA